MSEDRETPASRASETPETPGNPGAPVEETEASRTEILEAVERSRGAAVDAEPVQQQLAEPAAEETPRPGEAPRVAPTSSTATSSPAVPDDAELARRRAVSEIDTQLDVDVSADAASDSARAPMLDELPSAAAAESPVRDGEIRISSEHPMAALYMQTPMPPEIKGNRGAGVLIALLGTLGFAGIYAGVIALWLAPVLAPSQFMDGLLEYVLSWGYIAAVAAFLLGLIVLVLIVGRAGWWAYVLGGFLVGVLVWLAATAGYAASAEGVRALFERSPLSLAESFGLAAPAIGAGIVAREATVWFGAWIGARGRRIKRRNAEALAEYEAALAEVQAKRP
ncbi:hypothetical protein [Leucobacter triazinivorans]|uniref:Uncharacterized protein n=1 Tax=Leucobacter triazinivorans TaxID=1784719 RepID=A0A4P6KCX3_9MICO|nr:hypothetical protein [Leucobacter triazinivorans]QBE48127.1 hypothetical protein EVS81_04170 [Leucobacter triazinivorans]